MHNLTRKKTGIRVLSPNYSSSYSLVYSFLESMNNIFDIKCQAFSPYGTACLSLYLSAPKVMYWFAISKLPKNLFLHIWLIASIILIAYSGFVWCCLKSIAGQKTMMLTSRGGDNTAFQQELLKFRSGHRMHLQAYTHTYRMYKTFTTEFMAYTYPSIDWSGHTSEIC